MLQLKVGVNYCENIFQLLPELLAAVWLFQVCGLNTFKEISLPLEHFCPLCRPEQKAFFQIHKTHECCMPQDLMKGLPRLAGHLVSGTGFLSH